MMLSRILRAGAKPPRSLVASRLQSTSRTHVGHVRRINEDRILDRPERMLWAVADGMGGHQSGDVAAQFAIDALDALARPDADAVMRALESASAALYERSRDMERRSGTTIVAAILDERTMEIFWAGDSRAYRIRGRSLELLTRDHSLVQQLVDSGALSADEAQGHPKSNVITRALGVEENVAIDRVRVTVRGGDFILLCSDGLSRTLGPEIPPATSLQQLASLLMDQAMSRDGSDNASLVIAAIG